MGVQAAQEDVGEDTVMPGMWLEESAYGHTGSDIESFIHDDGDDDGHDPAKLMLLVERMLRQPPAPAGRPSASTPSGRAAIVAVAERMDRKLTVGSPDSMQTSIDTIGLWLQSPTIAAGIRHEPYAGPCDPSDPARVYRKEDDDSSRMLDLMAFAVRHRRWARLWHDTLLSFIGRARAWDHAHGIKEDGIPLGCGAMTAVMISAAFNNAHDRTGMVSPLSATMSMITGRVMDADTAANLPINGLYGPDRTPMDDLKAILGWIAAHPAQNAPGMAEDRKSASGRGTARMLISVFLKEDDGRRTGGIAASGHNGTVDDAQMFTMLTSPEFPADMDTAMDRTMRMFAPVRKAMASSRATAHPPMIGQDMAARLQTAPGRMLRMVASPTAIDVSLACDEPRISEDCPRTFSPFIESLHRSEDSMNCAAYEDICQRRGMMLASGTACTDWNRRDERLMTGIVRSMFPILHPRSIPLEMLRPRMQEDDTLHSDDFRHALAAALDSGNLALAAALNALCDIVQTADDGMSEGRSCNWVANITGSQVRTIIHEAAATSGLPDDFTSQTLLARMGCTPWMGRPEDVRFDHENHRRFVLDHAYGVPARTCWISIDWDR